MRKLTVFAAVTASLLAVSAFAAKPVASGLKPGDGVGAFDVVDVTGPSKGKQLCYRCQYGFAPVAAAFINGDPMQSGELLAHLQKLVDEHKARNLRSFVVYMGGAETRAAIEKVAKEKKISIPLTFLPAGPKAADISAYRISPEAQSTLILWNKGKVHANFVNPDKSSWGEVARAASTMLQ